MSRQLRLTAEEFAALNGGKKSEPKAIPAPLEHEEQRAFFDWWWLYADARKLSRKLCFCVPNGVSMSDAARQWMMGQGLTPGVSDIFLSIPSGSYSGCYMEVKRIGGPKPSDEQIVFIEAVIAVGYYAKVCYGSLELIECVTNYLSKRKNNAIR